jgi:hypothetical protein
MCYQAVLLIKSRNPKSELNYPRFHCICLTAS